MTARRINLLEAASKVFRELGPLSENRVQQFSNQLSKVALDLLAMDPSRSVQQAAATFLLARLDDSSITPTILITDHFELPDLRLALFDLSAMQN
eukprot:COSAG01_NODE_5396_length_4290_cov_1.512527_3_plen_95_part_00